MIYEVITKRGFRFRGSADHLSLVCDARHRDWHNARDVNQKTQRWERLDDLAMTELDDWKFIAIRGNGAFPNSCEATSEEGYLLGLISGNGWHNGSGYERNIVALSFHEQDESLALWVKDYIGKYGCTANVLPIRDAKAVAIRWSSKILAERLRSLGMVKALAHEKIIPEGIWRGSFDVVSAFLRGLMDTDGCATTKPSVVLVSTSESMSRGVQMLLQRFNVLSSLRFDPTVNHLSDRGIWRLEICGSNLLRYRDAIGFYSKRKMLRLPTKKANQNYGHIGWDRIKSVKPVGFDTVHGLTITPKPEYCSDGFLQHNSSKTEACLAEMVMCMTGQIPISLQDEIKPKDKLRGPINCRIVCESLTTVLHPIILPKLQWWKWTGVDQPGGEKGHWGWIPRDCLIGGDWSKSWSEKYRMLRVLYRDPLQQNRVIGESTLQCMSRDQDASDFASGDYHMILHDEPPTHAIWRENQARTMRVMIPRCRWTGSSMRSTSPVRGPTRIRTSTGSTCSPRTTRS
jgi:hypothetical protein